MSLVARRVWPCLFLGVACAPGPDQSAEPVTPAPEPIASSPQTAPVTASEPVEPRCEWRADTVSDILRGQFISVAAPTVIGGELSAPVMIEDDEGTRFETLAFTATRPVEVQVSDWARRVDDLPLTEIYEARRFFYYELPERHVLELDTENIWAAVIELTWLARPLAIDAGPNGLAAIVPDDELMLWRDVTQDARAQPLGIPPQMYDVALASGPSGELIAFLSPEVAEGGAVEALFAEPDEAVSRFVVRDGVESALFDVATSPEGFAVAASDAGSSDLSMHILDADGVTMPTDGTQELTYPVGNVLRLQGTDQGWLAIYDHAGDLVLVDIDRRGIPRQALPAGPGSGGLVEEIEVTEVDNALAIAWSVSSMHGYETRITVAECVHPGG